MTAPITPWSSAADFVTASISSFTSWVGHSRDSARLASYSYYEGLYYNDPSSYLAVESRDSVAGELLLQTSRALVESVHRFLGKDPSITVTGSDEALNDWFTKFQERERWSSKYSAQKRDGLIRGDVFWHIWADPNKPQGERISMEELHPGQFFPIWHPTEINKIVGCHIVRLVRDAREALNSEKLVVKRLTYRKVALNQLEIDEAIRNAQEPPVPEWRITSETRYFELGKWDDRWFESSDLSEISDARLPRRDVFQLPPQITSLPVYHYGNRYTGGVWWGSSELRGIESVINAIDQMATDTALGLAIAGLGNYWTDAGRPVDEDGNPASWDMGPLSVTEIGAGKKIDKLSPPSVAGQKEFMDHIWNFSLQAAGSSDVALGKVDSTVAESGISLSIQLAPMLGGNAEREIEMRAMYNQMFFDLINRWYPAYELRIDTATELHVVFGFEDAMPKNSAQAIEDCVALIEMGLMTPEGAASYLAKHGLNLDPADIKKAIEEKKKREEELRQQMEQPPSDDSDERLTQEAE